MYGGMGSAVTPDLSKGGEIDGDLVITGDFKVEGAGSFAFDEIIEGTQVIEKTSIEAFLVRKDSDGGDVFVVDTQDSRVEINGFLKFSNASYIQDIGNNYLKLRIASGDYFAIHGGASDTEYFRVADSGAIGIGGSPSTKFHVKSGHMRLDSSYQIQFGGSATHIDGDSGYMAIDVNSAERIRVNSNGQVGINDNNPQDTLQIDHATGTGGNTLSVNSNGVSGKGTLYVENKIGVGTASPSEKLHIVGELALEETSSSSGLIKFRDTDQAVIGQLGLARTTNDIVTGSANLDMAFRLEYNNDFIWGKSNAQYMRLTSGGTLGLGNGTSAYSANTKIDVRNGAIQSTTFYVGGEPYQGTIAYNNNGNIVHEPRASYDINFLLTSNEGISISDALLASAGTDIGGTTKDIGGLPFHFRANEPNFIIDSNYNTSGIWWGGANAGSNIKLLSANYTNQILEFNSWNDDGSAKKSDIFAIDGNNSRVGIGIASPSTIHHIHNSGATQGWTHYTNSSTGTTGDDGTHVGTNGLHAYIWNREAGDIYLGTQATTRVIVKSDGKTGIGTSSPTAKLHVDGTILSTGNLTVQKSFPDIALRADNEQRLNFLDNGGSIQSGIKNNAGTMKFYGSSSSGSIRALLNDTGLAVGGSHTPSAIIHASGANSTTLRLHNSSGALNYIQMSSSGGQTNYLQNNAGSIALSGVDDVRLNIGSTIRMKVDDNSRISLSNNDAGTDNTIFGKETATNLDAGTNYNVFIGHQVANQSLNDATNNVGIGYNSLTFLSQGDRNVAVGYQSLFNTSTGSNNVGLGFQALKANTTGVDNTAIGKSSMSAMLAGAYNIALGSNAMATYTGDDGNNAGTKNIAIGISSMEAFNGGTGNVHDDTRFDRNIALGYNSFRGGDFNGFGRVVTDNIVIGDEALNSTGTNNSVGTIAIGSNALTAITSGTGNTAIGHEVGKSMTDNANNTIMGYQAFKTANSGEHDNVVIGYLAGSAIDNAVSDGNVLIGKNAGVGGAGAMNSCIYIGNNAGENTHVRNQYDNVFIGRGVAGVAFAGQSDNNVGIGSGAMSTGALNGANNNVALGKDSLKALTTGDNNIAIGHNSLPGNTTAGNNVAIGINSMLNITTGQRNVAVGSFSMAMNHDGNARESVDNVFMGYNSGGGSWANASSNYNTAVGANTMDGACNSATGNVALGYGALTSLTEGDGNVALGMNTLEDLNTGTYNTGVGREAIKNVTTGTRNIGLGLESGITLTTGSYNTIIGSNADVGANNHVYTTSVGYQAESENDFETSLGFGGAFKFASFTYGADHASADDGDIASSHGTNIKIPAYAVIKSVSAIVTQLSNLGTFNLAVVYSDDANSPSDDAGMTNAVELIGADASTSKSGGSGNASDIECGSGAVLKKAFYNGFDGNGKHVGAGDRYIHLVQAGTGNGDTDPSTNAQVKILVEYVGMD